MTRKRKILIAVPLALVAIAAFFVVVGLLAGGRADSSADSMSGSGKTGATATETSRQAQAAPETGSLGSAASGSSKDSTQDISAAIPPASAPTPHYLVRTGDLWLVVGRHDLLPTVDRIKAMTAAMNGYVMSSAIGSRSSDVSPIEPLPLDATASSSDAASPGDYVQPNSAGLSDPYATLVVRVPEDLFEAAIKRFSKLGEVRSASTSSEDVTTQYVDLRARLGHYEAVERRLVSFLAETNTVEQMLAVQDRIDRVQLTIEELTAQLKSMRETTSYGTLSVYVTEKGGSAVVIHKGTTFGGTFLKSIRLLGQGARVTALVLTALAPFILVFGGITVLVWYIVRRLRRGRRQAAAPPTLSA